MDGVGSRFVGFENRARVLDGFRERQADLRGQMLVRDSLYWRQFRADHFHFPRGLRRGVGFRWSLRERSK